MKITYLVNQEQSDGSVCLCVATHDEWRTVVDANKPLPAEHRRRFIVDFIVEGNDWDIMIMEVPDSEYQEWNKYYLSIRRNRKAAKDIQVLSIDAPLADGSSLRNFLDSIKSADQVEELACDLALMDQLRKALSAWKPWGPDLLDAYLDDEKRNCTDILTSKFNVSAQVIRKYKRQFEEFAKKFLEGVSF